MSNRFRNVQHLPGILPKEERKSEIQIRTAKEILQTEKAKKFEPPFEAPSRIEFKANSIRIPLGQFEAGNSTKVW